MPLCALAALATPATPPTRRRVLQCWGGAGLASVSLLTAVFAGRLQSLDTKPAYSLASASLMLTDGLPTVLLRMRRQLMLPQGDLLCGVHNTAGRLCNAIHDAMVLLGQHLLQHSSASAHAAPGTPPVAVAARLLRSTAMRPALVVATLERLTQVMQLNAGLKLAQCRGRGIHGEGGGCSGWAAGRGAAWLR